MSTSRTRALVGAGCCALARYRLSPLQGFLPAVTQAAPGLGLGSPPVSDLEAMLVPQGERTTLQPGSKSGAPLIRRYGNPPKRAQDNDSWCVFLGRALRRHPAPASPMPRCTAASRVRADPMARKRPPRRGIALGSASFLVVDDSFLKCRVFINKFSYLRWSQGGVCFTSEIAPGCETTVVSMTFAVA